MANWTEEEKRKIWNKGDIVPGYDKNIWRNFLLKMAKHNDLATNGSWGYVVHRVGSPLMTNNKGEHFKIPQQGAKPDMDVEYFKAIRQIEQLFEEGKVYCGMYQWCMRSPNATPNELCKTTPWRKCNEERLCPYALLWKHWNLRGREPKMVHLGNIDSVRTMLDDVIN